MAVGDGDADPVRSLDVPVGEIMEGEFPRVGPSTPIAACISLMSRTGCRGLYVTGEDGRFLGVVTPGDILAHVLPEAGMGARRKAHHLGPLLSGAPLVAADVMSHRHASVPRDAPLSEAVRLLEKHPCPGLVVTGEGGVAVGVVDPCAVLTHLFSPGGPRRGQQGNNRTS
ncbi:MAG: CBS domain-containing protein [Methanolinea sp.]